MWYPCDGCYGWSIGWDEHDGGLLIGTLLYPECGDGCCWNRAECEECQGAGIVFVEE